MSTTITTFTAPPLGLLGAALAALQWARMAAWLLELHEHVPGPRVHLHHVEQFAMVAGTVEQVYGELAALDALRAQWVAEGDRLTARLEALDACRRAVMATAYAWQGERLERDVGVRETITLVCHAWRLYAGIRSEESQALVATHAALLGPIVVGASNLLEADPTRAVDVFNGGPLR